MADKSARGPHETLPAQSPRERREAKIDQLRELRGQLARRMNAVRPLSLPVFD